MAAVHAKRITSALWTDRDEIVLAADDRQVSILSGEGELDRVVSLKGR